MRILRSHQAELGGYGVLLLSIFGSVARDEAGPNSNVDLLVEFERPVGLFAFLRLQSRLEEWLGRNVYLATAGGLRPNVRAHVLREAVRTA